MKQLKEKNFAQVVRERFAALGGIELDLPKRDPIREPPEFDCRDSDHAESGHKQSRTPRFDN